MAGLTLRHISKQFGLTRVLDDISLELREGELLVLLGPSGCGKSTLLRIISGLEEADSGEVYIQNRRVDHLRPKERNVALVFQNYSLYPHMSVHKNLAFPLRIAGLSKRQIEERVNEVATMLDITERLAAKPAQLSGGQRQRVALGRAMIRQPSIFLLDEPLSNLDAELRVRMRQEIVRIQKEMNRTMVHVTHDQAEALSMADRIALLHEGKLQQVGTPEELYEKPVNKFVASFIGHPRINFVEVSISDGRIIPFGCKQPDYLRPDPPLRLCVGIRPESISLASEAELPAEVVACEYAGEAYVATINYQGHHLQVSRVEQPLKVGMAIRFALDTSRLLFFDPQSGRLLER